MYYGRCANGELRVYCNVDDHVGTFIAWERRRNDKLEINERFFLTLERNFFPLVAVIFI